MKKSLEKSKNVLEEKRKIGQEKKLHKKANTFTIVAMNIVQEKLKIASMGHLLNVVNTFFLVLHKVYWKC